MFNFHVTRPAKGYEIRQNVSRLPIATEGSVGFHVMNIYPSIMARLALVIIALSCGARLFAPVWTAVIYTNLSIWFSQSYGMSIASTFLRAKLPFQRIDLMPFDVKLYATLLAVHFQHSLFGPVQIGAFSRACILNSAFECSHFFTALFAMPSNFTSPFWFLYVSAWKLGAVFVATLTRTKPRMAICPFLKFFITPIANENTFLRHGYLQYVPTPDFISGRTVWRTALVSG
jgi:hypothetical protein